WAQSASVPRLFDVVISNGHIVDGTGSPWYSGDIGISDGKITAIGNLSDAQRNRTIDAHGSVVAPGFIDMLGQSELSILVDPRLPSKIFQGITTEITGEGNSVAPLNSTMVTADRTLPNGRPSASTSLGLRSSAWVSTSPVTSGPRPSAA